MSTSGFVRHALSGCAFAALLAGCGGSVGSNLATGSMPQPQQMKGASSSQGFVYVQSQASVSLLSYPDGQQVGAIGAVAAEGYCTDANGDVFIPEEDSSHLSSTIFEYASGGTAPIATLSDPGIAFSCAVDPTTGNLGVTNYADHSNHLDYGDLAIYRSATGTPTIYYNSGLTRYMYCSYDNMGNLYASAEPSGPFLVRLANGSNSIEVIQLHKSLFGDFGVFYPSVAWDGKNITVSSVAKVSRGHNGPGRFAIYRLEIKGRNARIVGTTTLDVGTRNPHLGQVWIQADTLLAAYQNKGQWMGVWSYPKGGKPTRSISIGQHYPTLSFGLTVSN